jgi:hypothetical protein
MWVFGRIRRGQALQVTLTAQAQATATAQSEATAAIQIAQETAQAAQATSTAQAVQATSTAQAAQATSTPKSIRATTAAQTQATATVLACIHETALAPPGWRVILCDTFNTNRNDWPLGDYEGERAIGNRSLTGGQLVWEAEALDDVIWWAVPDVSSVFDFYLTVDTRRTGGNKDAQYGVIFRKADGDNYGLFKIKDSQHFKLSLRHEGEWDTVIDWTEATAIRPGDPNRLTVLAEGSHYTFYINDQYVGEADDDRLSRGQAGLAVELLDAGDTATFEFDNFEVRAP